MKKLLYLFSIVGITALSSCEGDQGPQGIPGPDAQVYEITNVDFTPAGDFGVFFTFPSGALLSSDHVLVYRLVALDNGDDVWKPLPETFYFDDGTRDFSFEFDHTQFDVNIYMNGNDLATVSDEFRLDQIFRIVSIPGNFTGKNANVNLRDYDAVIKAYNIDESKIISLSPKSK